MTKHPAFAPSILTQLGLSAVVALMICGNADAMPPFAIAYGAKCTLCHLQVPALNAFGRYVQRTGYAALDPKKLHQTLPVWVGFNPSYDSQGATGAHRLQLGNVAVHGVGALSDDWTYHVQQWIRQNNQPNITSSQGFTDEIGSTFIGDMPTTCDLAREDICSLRSVHKPFIYYI